MFYFKAIFLWREENHPRAFPGKNTCGGWNSVNNLGYYHQNFNYYILFRSKVIPINVLENTCPGFKPSPSKIDKQHTL
jgi:hypothetical protein